MQILTILSALLLSGSALATRATYDNTYDNPHGSMNSVACSNGKNGLVDRFPTFGDVPNFPYIGGASAIEGWNSPQCGSCWRISYKDKSIYVTAIDFAGDGFNLSQKSLDDLTGEKAVELGSVEVNAVQVDKSKCGL